MNTPKAAANGGRRVRRLKLPGLISSYSILVVVYILLLFLLPANTAAMHSYHLSPTAYHVLLLIVEIPVMATWLAAFYGYSKLRDYANSISKTPEETGFNRLTLGFRWLAWSLVLPTILSLTSNSIANSYPSFHPTAIILTNYFNLFFPLVAFTLMSSGVDSLLAHEKWKQSYTQNLKPLLLFFAALSGIYCYLTLRYIDLGQPDSPNNTFYLPSWLLLFTIIIPYLYAWFVGLLAAYGLNTLATTAKGVLYRQAFSLLAAGVNLVIASSVGSQYLHTIVPRTGHLSLDVALLIVYIFYIVIILGFVLISLGANRLKRIEEI